jgi:hypothetical protein
MKTTITSFLLIWVCLGIQAQNLVPNPGFETYSACPAGASQITNATGWNYSRNVGDYLNSCSSNTFADTPTNYFGFQVPVSGQGYIGGLMYGSFINSYLADVREYFYVQLTTPLTIGTTYYVSFKVSLADNSEYAVNNIGAQFVSSYDANFPINNTAHVYTTNVVSNKTNWVTISGTFVPSVAYTGLMLGNFFTDANTTATFVGSGTDIGYNAYYYFDDIYVSTTPLLDITLTAFSAENAGTQNILHWKSESEDAGDYYEVERSQDARSFTKIATIEGEYNTGGSYQLIDKFPFTGINYYRLKMISQDGSYSYSKVVNAQVEKGGFVLDAYPNPVNDELTVQISEVSQGNAIVTIMDAAGNVVRRVPINGNTASIGMGDLPAGYYSLHYADDMVSKNVKVIKN